MPQVREIRAEELSKLLELYKHLHKADELADEPLLAASWQKIMNTPHCYYFVAEIEELFVSSCNLTIIPYYAGGTALCIN